jgi:hypothetical protein
MRQCSSLASDCLNNGGSDPRAMLLVS